MSEAADREQGGLGADRLREQPAAEARLDPRVPPRAEFTQTRVDLDRWKRGDREAFERLWDRYRPVVELLVAEKRHSIRNASVRSRLDTDDLLQDLGQTLLQTLEGFEYRGPGSLLAWLERVVQHRVMAWVDHWEAARRRPAADRSLDKRTTTSVGIADPVDPRAGPATAADCAERKGRLVAALVKLSERERKLVHLHYYMGASWDEIARDLSAPSADAIRKEHSIKVLPALAAALAQGA